MSGFSEVGEVYGHYRVTKVCPIEELRCTLTELVHEPTGADVMHIANEDAENLFCLGLRTWPTSSDGVAHILEHTVLCGSEKFPVKDPFFSMCHRSLNTYLNAMTGADFTCYPAASQVPTDLYNLMEVYLDGVFRPNLREQSFRQEGHRLEFSEPDNPESPLEYKGVVFNEMKGAMGSPNSRMMELLDAALFPDITYKHNSGGNPKAIPELSYEGLLNFHRTYYHPSRCLFFFYGNLPLQNHLDFLQNQLLNDFSSLPPLDPLPRQPRFSKPRRVEGRYPVGPDIDPSDQSMIVFGWLTCHILEQLELLALCLLENVLLNTDASPLKKALLKSGLCKQVEAYVDADSSEVPLVIALKGCRSEDAEALENLMMETLKDLTREGIPQELIENALHQLEFYRREITGDGAPFGVSLFFRAGLLKLHGGEAEDSLVIDTLFSRLRERMEKDPHYFSQLLDRYLINNPHFVRLTMHADTSLVDQEAQDEHQRLEAIKKALTQEQKEQIIQSTHKLAEFQKGHEEEDLSVLPKLSIDDVPKQPPEYVLKQQTCGAIELFHHDTFTNGILYADLVFPMEPIAKEDYPFVSLFSQLLPQVGCGGRSYAATLEYIQAHTGGVWSTLAFNRQVENPLDFSPAVHLRGKALHRKADKLFPLFLEMIHTADFSDRDRLRELLMKGYTALQNSMNQRAISYAMNLSASALDAPCAIENLWRGLDYYWTIKRLVENFDQESERLINTCQRLHKQLLNVGNPHLVLTTSEQMVEKLKKKNFYGLSEMTPRPFTGWECTLDVPIVEPQARIISSPVAFTAKIFRTVPFVHPTAAALGVVAHLLDTLVLHKRIREEGGAYGSGAANSAINGYFAFYSFRDPNLSQTLLAFDESIERMASGKFTEEELEEAKLEMIQSMDNPISPGSRGHLAYIWSREGKTTQQRQLFRDRILNLTKEEAITATREFLIPSSREGRVVSFAGQELLERETPLFLANGLTPLMIKTVESEV